MKTMMMDSNDLNNENNNDDNNDDNSDDNSDDNNGGNNDDDSGESVVDDQECQCRPRKYFHVDHR